MEEMILTPTNLTISAVLLFIFIVLVDNRLKHNRSLSIMLVDTIIHIMIVAGISVFFDGNPIDISAFILSIEVMIYVIKFYTIKYNINKWRRK